MKAHKSAPQELTDSVREGRAIAFVGAGYSRSLNLPLWSDLIASIKSRTPKAKKQQLEKLDPLQLPQYFVDIHGGNRTPLYELIDREFAKQNAEFGEQHKMLAAIPVNTIVTTNWDCAIERAFGSHDLDTNVIFRDDQVPSWNESQARQIIKMHGDINDKSSLVFTEEDYQSYPVKNAALVNLVKTLIACRTTIIVGFSLTDPNFKSIFYQLKRWLQTSSQRMYAVFVDEPDYLVDYWSRRGIEMIAGRSGRNQDRTSKTIELLQPIIDEAAVRAYDKCSRTSLLLKSLQRHMGHASPGYLLRLRASLGSFASPRPGHEFRVFSEEHDQSLEAVQLDKNEWGLNTTLREYLKRGSLARCIISLDRYHLDGKYTNRQLKKRLNTLKRSIQQFENIAVVDKGGEVEHNTVILERNFAFESIKAQYKTRLYDRARLFTHAEELANRISDFDLQFSNAMQCNIDEAQALQIDGETEEDQVRNLIVQRIEKLISGL